MPLTAGTRLGPYEIVGPLGAGGMGEVYRARDTRLGREVAVKVLPQHLSDQPEIRARFEREAKTISALNHPHICTLFDVGRSPGVAGSGETDYLVMELVEGDTLAARLRRGPLPAAELLRFGTQIADALDRAHRAGVIHRDLKPANVMLTKSGTKLMDFGLSRVTGLAGGTSASGATLTGLTQSPTVAQPLTAEGSLLGTFQYMAPEQLEGGEADARSDIWSLGCVLYEMATGRRAFEGRSQASLIAAILEREPPSVGDSSSGSGATPAAGAPPAGIDRLIRNCLAKDPDDRIQTVHDVKLQLQGIAEGAGFSSVSGASTTSATAQSVSRARRGASVLPWALAVLATLAAVAAVAWLYPLAHAPARAVRFRIGPPGSANDAFWPRVSPDGTALLFEVDDSLGTTRSYVRAMDQVEAHPIPGAEGTNRAYWSPDGREIAFVRDSRLVRLSIAGGTPTVICSAVGGSDVSWGSKGSILLDGTGTDSLRVVSAGGGELQPATSIDRTADEIGSAWPCFLPDGEHFLFVATKEISTSGGHIRLGRLGSLDSKLLGDTDGRVEYAPGGWVLYLKGQTLLARKLDLGAGRLEGQPLTITDGLRVGSSAGHFSISQSGVLALGEAPSGQSLRLTAADRSGTPHGAVLATGSIGNMHVSPDGRNLLYERFNSISASTGEIYVLDLVRGTDTRLTFTDQNAATAVWSPDGRRFAFIRRAEQGKGSLVLADASGIGGQDSVRITADPDVKLLQWLAPGSRLVGSSSTSHAVAIPTEGAARVPVALGDSTTKGLEQQVSPDGHWMAFVWGTFPDIQIFVQSLVGAPGRWQISTKPGAVPVWTRGGRELLYETFDGRLMAVEIDTQSGFHAGTPQVLFTLPWRSQAVDSHSWAVDDSGEHFWLTLPPPRTDAGFIEVVTDFHSLVSRK